MELISPVNWVVEAQIDVVSFLHLSFRSQKLLLTRSPTGQSSVVYLVGADCPATTRM